MTFPAGHFTFASQTVLTFAAKSILVTDDTTGLCRTCRNNVDLT